ncbi:MAG: hypothetical protein NE328_00640 [Lentisphaeraceae bacterium]|nr:hypothetical protein [Lentisphaeraceae bacterium]
MKKSERKLNSEVRKKLLEKDLLAEKTIDEFLSIAQSSLKVEDWVKYYQEANEQAGNSIHIFEYIIFALKETQTEITKPLREAIDEVIEANDLIRDRVRDLNRLNFTLYWKQHYGYN